MVPSLPNIFIMKTFKHAEKLIQLYSEPPSPHTRFHDPPSAAFASSHIPLLSIPLPLTNPVNFFSWVGQEVADIGKHLGAHIITRVRHLQPTSGGQHIQPNVLTMAVQVDDPRVTQTPPTYGTFSITLQSPPAPFPRQSSAHPQSQPLSGFYQHSLASSLLEPH